MTHNLLTAPKNTYRRTKNGEWVVFGEAKWMSVGQLVPVFTKDGKQKSEWIARIGKPFDVNGKKMVYGYIEAGTRRQSAGSICGECGERRVSGTTCWETGHNH